MAGQAQHNLAIEAASRRGAIALGRGGRWLAEAGLPIKRRHNIELIPAIDALLAGHGLGPADLAEVYVSLGPGSFTGLRIALATAKMLALSRGVRVVGVPTLEALRLEHPEAMVCLNVKRGSAWSAGPGFEAALRTLDAIEAAGLPVVGEAMDGAAEPRFSVRRVWELGRARAKASAFDEPATLTPLYIREPEAVTLWNEKEQVKEQESVRPGAQEFRTAP